MVICVLIELWNSNPHSSHLISVLVGRVIFVFMSETESDRSKPSNFGLSSKWSSVLVLLSKVRILAQQQTCIKIKRRRKLLPPTLFLVDCFTFRCSVINVHLGKSRWKLDKCTLNAFTITLYTSIHTYHNS